MIARTTMAIQIRLTKAPAAWNKSHKTNRITAATSSRWITLFTSFLDVNATTIVTLRATFLLFS